MSVLERFQDLSRMEFYRYGLSLKLQLQHWLGSDSVVNKYNESQKTYHIESFDDMPEYDMSQVGGGSAVQKFIESTSVVEVKPKRTELNSLEDIKLYLLDQSRTMMSCIIKANNVYIGANCSKSDAELRESYQAKSVECTIAIIEELYELKRILPSEARRIELILQIAARESDLLSKWKRNDAKRVQQNIAVADNSS